MKTFKELKNFCEKNNVRYEVNPIYSSFYNPLSNEEHKFVIGYEIGMNNISGRRGKSEWQWVWFETIGCPEELEDTTILIFRNRYSQVNGKNYKRMEEDWNANKTIERRS